MQKLTPTLVQALKRGQPLTHEQVRQVITHEAKLVGLTYQQALRRARRRSLPRNHIGADLQLLIDMLHA